MRVSHWCCALLILGVVHAASAEEAVADDTTSMDIIEMLGEIGDEMSDLEIAMSDENLDVTPIAQEVKNAE
jgi:hypothetical protein